MILDDYRGSRAVCSPSVVAPLSVCVCWRGVFGPGFGPGFEL